MRPRRPEAKRSASRITADERTADMILRTARRLLKIGVKCPIGEAELAWVEAERNRLRQLRGV